MSISTFPAIAGDQALQGCYQLERIEVYFTAVVLPNPEQFILVQRILVLIFQSFCSHLVHAYNYVNEVL